MADSKYYLKYKKYEKKNEKLYKQIGGKKIECNICDTSRLRQVEDICWLQSVVAMFIHSDKKNVFLNTFYLFEERDIGDSLTIDLPISLKTFEPTSLANEYLLLLELIRQHVKYYLSKCYIKDGEIKILIDKYAKKCSGNMQSIICFINDELCDRSGGGFDIQLLTIFSYLIGDISFDSIPIQKLYDPEYILHYDMFLCCVANSSGYYHIMSIYICNNRYVLYNNEYKNTISIKKITTTNKYLSINDILNKLKEKYKYKIDQIISITGININTKEPAREYVIKNGTTRERFIKSLNDTGKFNILLHINNNKHAYYYYNIFKNSEHNEIYDESKQYSSEFIGSLFESGSCQKNNLIINYEGCKILNYEWKPPSSNIQIVYVSNRLEYYTIHGKLVINPCVNDIYLKNSLRETLKSIDIINDLKNNPYSNIVITDRVKMIKLYDNKKKIMKIFEYDNLRNKLIDKIFTGDQVSKEKRFIENIYEDGRIMFSNAYDGLYYDITQYNYYYDNAKYVRETYYDKEMLHIKEKKWFKEGELHNDDDYPAIIVYDNKGNKKVEKWVKDGKIHREDDNPAILIYWKDLNIPKKGLFYTNGISDKTKTKNYNRVGNVTIILPDGPLE